MNRWNTLSKLKSTSAFRYQNTKITTSKYEVQHNKLLTTIRLSKAETQTTTNHTTSKPINKMQRKPRSIVRHNKNH